jgi:prevent-host-death family protein
MCGACRAQPRIDSPIRHGRRRARYCFAAAEACLVFSSTVIAVATLEVPLDVGTEPQPGVAWPRQRFRIFRGYNSQMKTASISQAKNRLSAYIDLVRQGNRVVITDRGRPVAELAPVSHPQAAATARLAMLERKGWLQRGDKTGEREIPKPVRPRNPRLSIVGLLIRERESGW